MHQSPVQSPGPFRTSWKVRSIRGRAVPIKEVINMTKANRLWVLGAGDPEMGAIETLLRKAGEKVAYATVGGVRVHPGNAYRADGSEGQSGDALAFDEIVLVECGFDKGHPWEKTGTMPVYGHPTTGLVILATDGTEVLMHHLTVVRVDHHRPGDPGYGVAPEEFLRGSSIGQVVALLAKDGNDAVFSGWIPEYAGADTSPTGTLYHGPCGHWAVQGMHSSYELPEDFVLTAAADHCLEAAYRGKCPGVDPERLMRWRVETRAAFQKRPVADVLRDVKLARTALRDAVDHYWSGQQCPHCGAEFYTVPVAWEWCPARGLADLRGKSIPELPEAAAREGIPFLSTVRDKDGREKVVIQAAWADLVKKFLNGEIVPDLKDFYGDPARGFAGGYTTAK